TTGALKTQSAEPLGLTSAWTDEVNESYGSGGVDEQYGLAQTDIEGLTAVGDANLFFSGATQAADDPENYVTAMEKNPIWNNLPAVKDGRTAQFSSSLWTAGGPRSCIALLDAYVEALDQISK
ncbi:MAG: Fe3+-hydroxamate ABC transporter, partial [Corynebacterium variabile]